MSLNIQLPTTDTLRLALDGSTLRIWLNRPDARNALSDEMVAEFCQVLDAVRDERALRSIVIRGEGGIFCAGGDIKGFKNVMQGTMQASEVAASNRSFGDFMLKVNEQPQVVIMLVEGAAIGGGLGLSCVGDVTIATTDARFRLSETSLGIPPAQIAPFVVERIGLTQARRLMLTGARFNGEQALAYGLVHSIAANSEELEQQCNEILEHISVCGAKANAITKSILFETTRRPRPDALDFASQGFAACMLGEEGREGIAAFIEKRAPSWSGKR
ncbi:MAG: enoyl-CoA hydratase/isomerase family protein [Pseudomonadales bacterium]|nr:enoyl-CoA hydratase/isomerase family protein [Pseudomonadales bacterium]